GRVLGWRGGTGGTAAGGTGKGTWRRGKPRKRFGQHFLEPAWVTKVIGVIAPSKDQTFLEIGPGRGALTRPLAEGAGRVVAVELDARLAAELQRRDVPRLTVVPGDALKTDLAALVPSGTRLVGNLPYYVSSPLLRRFLDLRGHVTDV